MLFEIILGTSASKNASTSILGAIVSLKASLIFIKRLILKTASTAAVNAHRKSCNNHVYKDLIELEIHNHGNVAHDYRYSVVVNET
ncbi:hypothetical protein Lwal_2295 [Legionella waltersii]|uniref:Uncharacterized protein n=1 Tax=Legionella waltersii TaxID=66969 RepID=A0A0W1A5E7_9GAMM|nr:hypothetical protein Lwal_2295 [Legionella waltersii]SNU94429.1 Uncharacterised protein [Legionella waltersii]